MDFRIFSDTEDYFNQIKSLIEDDYKQNNYSNNNVWISSNSCLLLKEVKIK
jgi:hypothetical protein